MSKFLIQSLEAKIKQHINKEKQDSQLIQSLESIIKQQDEDIQSLESKITFKKNRRKSSLFLCEFTLSENQGSISSVLRQEVFMISSFDDLSVLDDQNRICMSDC